MRPLERGHLGADLVVAPRAGEQLEDQRDRGRVVLHDLLERAHEDVHDGVGRPRRREGDVEARHRHLAVVTHDLDQQALLGAEVVVQQAARDARLAGHVVEGRPAAPRRATDVRIASTMRLAFSPPSSPEVVVDAIDRPPYGSSGGRKDRAGMPHCPGARACPRRTRRPARAGRCRLRPVGGRRPARASASATLVDGTQGTEGRLEGTGGRRTAAATVDRPGVKVAGGDLVIEASKAGGAARARASAVGRSVSVFDGLVTADAVRRSVTARDGEADYAGSVQGPHDQRPPGRRRRGVAQLRDRRRGSVTVNRGRTAMVVC
jgi:hypothetical protein